jgi:hypothetical protein
VFTEYRRMRFIQSPAALYVSFAYIRFRSHVLHSVLRRDTVRPEKCRAAAMGYEALTPVARRK